MAPSMSIETKCRVEQYVQACIRMKIGSQTLLPAPQNLQLLRFLLSDADLLEITLTTVLHYRWMFFCATPSFLSGGQTLWCPAYRAMWYFKLCTFCGPEGNSNVVLCTNMFEVLHQGRLLLKHNTHE